nr:nuclease-related domain-containing protein [Aquibacillus albus]
MELSEQEEQNLLNLQQGYRGECAFDRRVENLGNHCIILNDLLLEHSNTMFQLDSLFITQQKIYLFEVKNYEGDYYVDGDRWYMKSGKEVKNPLLQLKRSETLLRQVLQQLKINLPVESYLVMINPHFFLYNTPIDLPILFHSQLNRFLSKLKTNLFPLNKNHKTLAELLRAIHIEKSPYVRIPDYTFEGLRKGIFCNGCGRPMEKVNRVFVRCRGCNCEEVIDTSIVRSLGEYKLLFPDRKITTNGVYDWCGGLISRYIIRRILVKEYDLVGNSKNSYFIKKE